MMLDHARAEASIGHAIPFCAERYPDSPEDSNPQQGITTEHALAAAFDLLRMSVILTDGAAQIIYANCHARNLLREQRCLRVCTGKLSAVNPKSALQIRHAIRRCSENQAIPALCLGIAVPLLRTDERSIAAWVLPMQASDRGNLRRAAIFIRSTIDLFSEDMFASIFGATSAELRVLKLLMNGMCIHEVSAALKLSHNTVRTHVKSLFAKTGTTRQSELLRLAAFSIAPVSAQGLRRDETHGTTANDWAGGRKALVHL
jgi:DNA-binding CsgD family transcriptional regulator